MRSEIIVPSTSRSHRCFYYPPPCTSLKSRPAETFVKFSQGDLFELITIGGADWTSILLMFEAEADFVLLLFRRWDACRRVHVSDCKTALKQVPARLYKAQYFIFCSTDAVYSFVWEFHQCFYERLAVFDTAFMRPVTFYVKPSVEMLMRYDCWIGKFMGGSAVPVRNSQPRSSCLFFKLSLSDTWISNLNSSGLKLLQIIFILWFESVYFHIFSWPKPSFFSFLQQVINFHLLSLVKPVKKKRIMGNSMQIVINCSWL